ncbi:hypothetical protein [Jiangella anatolica]|nr:hypothetical protein [Jiangella anatolica]
MNDGYCHTHGKHCSFAPTTPQEHRDQDYMDGYGYGIVGTKTEHQLSSHTVAFIRGYRDAVKDREARELAKREGGESA